MMRTQIARTLGVKQLYHYQPANIDWLRRTISENTVHCPSSQDFNDPWDCRPSFNLDCTAARERLIAYVDKAYRKWFPGKSEDEYRQRICQFRNDPNLQRAVTEISGAIGEQYRVYCLSTRRDSILMWGLYADKHCGVCLGFSTDNEEFGGAYRVEYCEEYPKLDYTDTDDTVVILPLITKSAEWSHEREFRVIAEEERRARSSGSLHTQDKQLPIPDNGLISVIFGCLTPPNFREEIRSVIHSSGRKIELMEAQRIPNRYALSIGP